jgi:hypothetical protein
MQLQIVISDFSPNVNITEAGFDHFTVTNMPTVSVPTKELSNWKLYPNPSQDKLQIQGNDQIGDWCIFDVRGIVLLDGYSEESSMEIKVSTLTDGIYFLRFQEEVRQWVKQ